MTVTICSLLSGWVHSASLFWSCGFDFPLRLPYGGVHTFSMCLCCSPPGLPASLPCSENTNSSLFVAVRICKHVAQSWLPAWSMPGVVYRSPWQFESVASNRVEPLCLPSFPFWLTGQISLETHSPTLFWYLDWSTFRWDFRVRVTAVPNRQFSTTHPCAFLLKMMTSHSHLILTLDF